MRDYLVIGPAPAAEDCAQVGEENYVEQSKEECRRFIDLIRKTVGPERGSAKLATKGFPHDFGTYYEVVVYFDDNDEEGMNYAYEVEANAPEYWDENQEKVV